MSEPIYDFRDGMLLEKVVYKDESYNCGYFFLYLLCLLLTWIWGSGWFALFFYSYVFHEKIALITFVVIWCIFAAIVVTIGILTIQRSKNEKRIKKEKKEERERELNEIKEAKRRRAERMKNMNENNFGDIITNEGPNQNDYINYNSERKDILDTNVNLISEEKK